MKNMREFDDILNECIERLLKGGTVADCLGLFPEHAAELEPLLLTAADAHKAADILPRPEFRQRAGYEFQAAVRDMKPVRGGLFRWPLRWVTSVSAALAVLLAGGSTIAASANSLPDESLYGVKLFTEEVRLAFTPSTLGKVQLYAEFTDTRVAEIVKMADEGNVAQVVQTTERMSSNLVAIAALIQPAGVSDASGAGGEPQLMLGAPEAAAVPPMNNQDAEEMTASAPAIKALPVTDENMERAFISSEPVSSAAAKDVGNNKTNGKEALKNTVSEQALKNTRDLLEVLARAPESVKPALEKAIEIAEKGYEQALDNSVKNR